MKFSADQLLKKNSILIGS